jgi:flagellar FliL protein
MGIKERLAKFRGKLAELAPSPEPLPYLKAQAEEARSQEEGKPKVAESSTEKTESSTPARVHWALRVLSVIFWLNTFYGGFRFIDDLSKTVNYWDQIITTVGMAQRAVIGLVVEVGATALMCFLAIGFWRGFKFKRRRVIVIGLVTPFMIAIIGAITITLWGVISATNPSAPPTVGTTVTPLGEYELEQFRVNLADRDVTAYLQADIVLVYDVKLKKNAKLEEELKTKQNEIRDIVNLILNSKTSQELINVEGKETLKREIVDKINRILTSGRIEKAYLKNFVIQTL